MPWVSEGCGIYVTFFAHRYTLCNPFLDAADTGDLETEVVGSW
jgi:hypothetical protein